MVCAWRPPASAVIFICGRYARIVIIGAGNCASAWVCASNRCSRAVSLVVISGAYVCTMYPPADRITFICGRHARIVIIGAGNCASIWKWRGTCYERGASTIITNSTGVILFIIWVSASAWVYTSNGCSRAVSLAIIISTGVCAMYPITARIILIIWHTRVKINSA